MTPTVSLVAVICSGCVSPPPAPIPLRLIVCCAASSAIAAGSAIASSVGRSFTGVTVTVKVRETTPLSTSVARSLSRPPSVTVTVMTLDPDAFGTGVYCSVPVAPGDV